MANYPGLCRRFPCGNKLHLLSLLHDSLHDPRSVVPIAFWYFSLAGGATLLTYAIYREDPVFIVGQAAGLLIYSRNLYLIFRERRDAAATES